MRKELHDTRSRLGDLPALRECYSQGAKAFWSTLFERITSTIANERDASILMPLMYRRLKAKRPPGRGWFDCLK